MSSLENQIKPSGFFEKNGGYHLIKRLLSENISEFIGAYAIAVIFMVLVAATTALSAWIMRDVVESLFIEKDFQQITFIALAIIGIFLVKGISTYGQVLTLSRIGNAIIAKVQMQLYDKILAQGGDFFVRYPSNDLVTRISSNAQNARTVLDLLVVSLGRDLLTLIGLITVMLIQDIWLSFISLVIAPPIVIMVSMLVRRVRKVAKQLFVSSTQIISALQDTVGGIKIIKSFLMEETMRHRMAQSVDDVRLRNNKIAELSARTSPVMETFGGICIGLMILYAGWQVSSDGKTPAEFMAFLTALLLAYEPAKRLARLHIGLEAGLVGVRLMYEILDSPIDVTDNKDDVLKLEDGTISFEKVDFSYQNGSDENLRVLKSISLRAKGGETTALVGPSGSGKTTLINLVQRFYDIDKGAVLIDGQDIRDISLKSLRYNIAYVSQDTFLFSGSVKENILAGRPNASFDEVVEAAKNANAHEFIQGLENGYDTDLGENGTALSGGQRQRLAIARAFLKNAAILLLDEATSALDAESEKLVQEAFEKLKKGRTTLVIAHRLSTIRNAECIYVMQKGTCIENGTHDDLIAKDSVYKHFYDLQFKSQSGNK